MKRVVLCVAVFLSWPCCCVAQESKSDFEFLKQFAGDWRSAAILPGADSDASSAPKSKISAKTVGEFWVVLEHQGQFGEMKFHAVQTLGYDKQKKQFVGTWIDSVKDYMWRYTGKLEQPNRLVLDTEGPDWTDNSKMRSFRDIYEFKSENEILATSQMKNDEGKWETFMTAKIVKANHKKTSMKSEQK